MVKKFILLMLTVVIGLHFKVSTYASEYPSPDIKCGYFRSGDGR